MKRIKIFLAIALVISGLLGITSGVSAQGGTWVSGIMVVNQNPSDDAHITVTFYWAEGQAKAGQVALTFTDTIPAGKSASYYVPTNPKTRDALDPGFVGSVVISSDQPVAANVNTQVPSGSGSSPSNPNRVGTSSGVLIPYSTLYFPEVMKAYGGWNSYVAIQNTMDQTATVTIRYYNASNGAEVSAAAQTLTISPYSTRIFRQQENGNLANNWVGSAVVTSEKELAGICNFYNAGTSVATAAFLSYNAFGAGSTKLYVPRIVRNYYGYQSGLTIQNISGSATDVYITFYYGTSTYNKVITNLQPSASAVLYMPNVSELSSVAGSGSAVITTTAQSIVAIVNEDNRTLGQGITYNAALSGSETSVIVFPQVTSRFYAYASGLQVQNVDTTAADLTITFSMAGHADEVKTVTVQPNQSWSGFAPNLVSYKGFNGSVTVVSTNAKNIVGIANMSYRADRDPVDAWAPNYGDSFAAYNGINN